MYRFLAVSLISAFVLVVFPNLVSAAAPANGRIVGPGTTVHVKPGSSAEVAVRYDSIAGALSTHATVVTVSLKQDGKVVAEGRADGWRGADQVTSVTVTVPEGTAPGYLDVAATVTNADGSLDVPEVRALFLVDPGAPTGEIGQPGSLAATSIGAGLVGAGKVSEGPWRVTLAP